MFRKSSLSGDTNCVEADTENPRWCRCATAAARSVRRRPQRPPLTFTVDEFLDGVGLGEFDV